MKHLKTIITTLLLSIIASPMSADTGGTYRLVTDPNDLEEGDIIVIASYDNVGNIVIMGEKNPSYNEFMSCINPSPAISIEKPVTMPSTLTIPNVNAAGFPIELKAKTVTKNKDTGVITTLYFTQANNSNQYLFTGDKGNDLFWKNEINNWKTRTDYSLINGVYLNSNNKDYYFIKYNTNTDLRCFKTYSNVQDNNNNPYNLAVCYKKVVTPQSIPFTMNAYGYATLYYSDKSLILPAGLKAYTYTVEGNELKVLDKFDGNSSIESNRIVPKGAAVLIQGAPGNYELEETTAETYAQKTQNVLSGTDVETNLTGDGSKYYMLSTGSNGIGFYWGADGGAAFTNGANKAYLRIPAGSSAKAALHFSLPTDDDTPTGITTPNSAKPALPTPSYNLQGINATHQGIIISNGKKLLKR